MNLIATADHEGTALVLCIVYALLGGAGAAAVAYGLAVAFKQEPRRWALVAGLIVGGLILLFCAA